jgi:hypothetical protein
MRFGRHPPGWRKQPQWFKPVPRELGPNQIPNNWALLETKPYIKHCRAMARSNVVLLSKILPMNEVAEGVFSALAS